MDLCDLRKERGLTLKEVAGCTGIHLASISNYENGTREPGIKHIRLFADFYGINIGEVFECAERSMKQKRHLKKAG